MDDDLRALLVKWKIPDHYIEKLIDEEVLTVDTLLLLSDDAVKGIFPKVGTQAAFLSQLRLFRGEQCDDVILSVDDLTNIAEQIIAEHSENLTPLQEQTSNATPRDASVKNTAEETSEDPTVLHGSAENQLDLSDSEVQDDGTPEKQSGSAPPSVSPPAVRPSQSSSGSRKRSATSSSFGVFDVDLVTLLKSCLRGKEVWAYYEGHNDLNECHRNKLADVMLNEYLKDENDKRLPPDVEKDMADLILETFPTEYQAIWVSDTVSKRESSVGRGILLKRYYHIRRNLRKSGVINKNDKDKETTHSNFLGPDKEVSEAVKEKLAWLNYNKQPWSKVIESWELTAETRIRTLLSGSQSIDAYMNLYPALKDKSGFLLFESDFQYMFKDANSLYSQYPQLSACIESKISAERLTEIKDSLTADGKKARTFQSLPFLLNVVTVAKQKKKSFRPSRLEVAESILLCVATVGDIVPALETRLQKYSLFGLQLGPQAIIVGTEDAHSKSFVRINAVLYQVENATKAVDIAFKSFHALDAKYPEESKREWLFLERAIYGINVSKKGLDSSTSKLIKDFESFLSKES